MRDHLIRFHRDCDNNEESLDIDYPSTSGSRQSSIRSVASYFSRAIEYEKNSKSKKKNIEDALSRLVTKGYQPINIVCGEEFKNCVHDLCCRVPKV